MIDLSLDPATTALVLIDLQKGIVSTEGAPHSADSVVENAKKLVEKFRSLGALVVFVHVAFRDKKDQPNPTVDNAPPSGQSPANFAELVLDHDDEDLVILKRQWGAFYGTELDLQLRRRGIKTIVLGGIATSFGVESTARDAFERGYDQVFVEDVCTNRNAEAHKIAFEVVFPRIGLIRSTEQVLSGIA